jgi:hemerythrin-like domain-containing protein
MKTLSLLTALLIAPALAAGTPRRPTDGFRKEHVEIKVHLDHVRAWAADLRGAPDRRATMTRIVSFFTEHIRPHAEWEEKVLYPAVDRRAGSRETHPFTATMRHEHRIVGRWIDELAAEARKPRPDAVAFQRRTDNLLGLIMAHFELEEEVLLPVLDATMTPAEFDREIGRAGH